MDDFHCWYGVFTTYNRTWFLRRANDDQFFIRTPVSSEARSTASEVSLTECILFIALKAMDQKEYFYPKRVGLALVKRKDIYRAFAEGANE